MDKTYKRRVEEIKSELSSLSLRVKMLEELNIEIDTFDMSNDLLRTVSRILSHAESEIVDIYNILYRMKLEKNSKS